MFNNNNTLFALSWTEQRVARLKHLHAEGLSCKQISAELGCSKNAVIGKLHRLGFSTPRPPKDKTPVVYNGGAPRRRGGSHPSASRSKVKPSEATMPDDPQLIDHTPGSKTLFDLGPLDCRFPLGATMEPAVLFCGAVKAAGQPYCGAHCKVAFNGFGAAPRRVHVREKDAA